MRADVRARLERLLVASRRVLDRESGGAARARLAASTGLSEEGVALALEQSLELFPTEGELEALAVSVRPSPRAHVILSSTVFTAAHRALALALCASPRVFVKPSRRDPVFAELVHEVAPELFARVARIEPAPGDAVFAYGTAEMLSDVRGTLPAGTWFFAHGPGVGLVAAHEDALESARARDGFARELALDVAPFDQRGCLSPRLVLVEGGRQRALSFAEAAADALAAAARRVPRGRLTAGEAAEIRRFRDTLAMSGDVLAAGPGWVGVAEQDAALALCPVGRNLLVVPVASAARAALSMARHVTTWASIGDAGFERGLRAALPRARAGRLGALQAPPFDGPVDLRTDPELSA